MKEKRLSITRKTVTLASILAILITVLVLMVISFTVKQYSQFSESASNDLSGESAPREEISLTDDSDSYHESVHIDIEISDVFADSNSSEEEKSDIDNSEDGEDIGVGGGGSNIEEEPTITHGWVINEYGYTYVYDNCGYEQFNYKFTALERYSNALNGLADIIPEETRLFNITVPVSSTFADIPREVYIEDNFFNQSQSAFVSTVASKISENYINVPIVTLIEELYDNDEYVFFRTDKNWTSLGAYNAYRAFCEKAGINAYSLESFSKKEVGDFLGSFYSATQSADMFDSPDTLMCYSTLPSVNTALIIYDSNMMYTNYSLCNNKVSAQTGFDVFLGKSAARYEICSNAEEGSLLIIGDSSAHPIVPFLASHYSKIDVIDPRKIETSLSEFLAEHEYDDCITMCYSTNAVSGEYIPSFSAFLTEDQPNE